MLFSLFSSLKPSYFSVISLWRHQIDVTGFVCESPRPPVFPWPHPPTGPVRWEPPAASAPPETSVWPWAPVAVMRSFFLLKPLSRRERKLLRSANTRVQWGDRKTRGSAHSLLEARLVCRCYWMEKRFMFSCPVNPQALVLFDDVMLPVADSREGDMTSVLTDWSENSH